MTPNSKATNGTRLFKTRRTLALVALAAAALALPQIATASSASAAGNKEVDLRDFGARCDGSSNDRPALDGAIQALAAQGGGTLNVPAGDCRIVQGPSTVFIGVPSNVTIQGVGNQSRLVMGCEGGAAYAELFRVGGQNIAFRDLSLERDAACDAILVSVHAVNNLTLQNVSFNGNASKYDNYVHGVLLTPVEGPVSGLTMDHVSMTDLDFGLLQPSNVTQPVTDITVDSSRFSGNWADDLEFNAPAGLMQNVTVTRSSFSNNRSNGEGSGFGVGLANVQHAKISRNKFYNYSFEPVHIEDRSADVTVRKNKFRKSFTANRDYASHVFIVNNSQNVRVVGNMFDTAKNCNPVSAVFVNPGGAGLAAPSQVSVRHNTLYAGRSAELAYHVGVSVKIGNNKVTPKRGC